LSRQKILEAAFECFSKECYCSVTLAEIAEKAGIKKPSIYAHFNSKEELFLETLDIEVNRVYIHINKIISDGQTENTETIMHKILLGSIDYIKDDMLVGRFWSNLLFAAPVELCGQVSPGIDKFKDFIYKTVLKLIEQGVDSGSIRKQEPQDLAYSYICLLEGNLLMATNSKRFSMDKADMSWKLFWDGIKREQ
jgi:AcrR family transcriptional regulator